MAQKLGSEIVNNFTKGLITESTGLNFPENAATDSDNCEYTLLGDVNRRFGIVNETNNIFNVVSRTNKAISTYKWNNAGGDGLTQVVVEQVGGTLYFYQSSNATINIPLSATLLASTVDVSSFVAVGGVFDATLECQYSDGNGYLIVYHPSCDPFYCTFNTGTITGNIITVQIRDYAGIPEAGVADNFRPLTLSNEHKYNLVNQGWIAGAPWSATSTTSNTFSTGAKTFTIATGITGIVAAQSIVISDTTVGGVGHPTGYLVGTVTSYTTGTGALVVSVTSFFQSLGEVSPSSSWSITPVSTGYINTWQAAVGNYPSNADQWWRFKNASNVFDPATTQANTYIGSGPAPKGSLLLNAFQQQRSAASGVVSLTDVTTTVRPRTGCWFQGRAWYTGVDAQFPATGDAPYTTWTENIYFSQIITNTSQLGRCYQQNDSASEKLFDLLPTDGGVITIQGCGSIYKLFPLVNALIVFAANGVWYLTGSTGIGFAANDYTIVKLSAVKSISSTSFVDVQGLPMFWNAEGIYKVEPAKQGTSLLSSPLHVNPLEVRPVTLGTILSFYNQIPLSSKKYARGAYDPVSYILQWAYKDTEATSVTDRYTFNKLLNYNDSNNAFFPYTVDTTAGSINSIIYVIGPGGSLSAAPDIKYVSSFAGNMTFAAETDMTFKDWGSVNFISYFVTGYKLKGDAIKKFQPQYIQVYSKDDGTTKGYKIKGRWNYALLGDSNKISNEQKVTLLGTGNFKTVFKRHKIRGNGYALQFQITSVDGLDFDIQGWAVLDSVNQGA